MIIRKFHPIGQGAFYSEEFYNLKNSFKIVYDCGNFNNLKYADKVIEQAFNKNDIIDILFISHFDYDHVSKISKLRDTVKKIKNVVLPLLYENTKNLLLKIYKYYDDNVFNLINNPQNFFGEETKIIFVNYPENDEGTYIDNSLTDIEKINMTGKKIDSGTQLFLKDREWVFIPYNYMYLERHEELVKMLKQENINVKKLINDIDYTLYKIISDIGKTKKEGGKIFKRIYDSLEDTININSMILYSGPLSKNNDFQVNFFVKNKCCFNIFEFFNICYNNYNKAACIYTGDTNLNKVFIKSKFKQLWDNVGTIQVPHHGSKRSFNADILDGDTRFFPISYGTDNIFGHPSSKVISDIFSNGKYPILINDKFDSIFVQTIKKNHHI